VSGAQQQLQQVAQQLHDDLEQMWRILGPLEDALGLRSLEDAIRFGGAIPGGGGGVVDLTPLTTLLQGIKTDIEGGVSNIDHPWNGHMFFTATEPINSTGNTTQLGRPVDFILARPSIDAQLEFDTPIATNTPTIAAGNQFLWTLKCSSVNHRAATAGATGTLDVFAAWF